MRRTSAEHARLTRDAPAPRSTIAFIGTVLAMLATFRMLDIAIPRLGALPADAYRDVVFLPNLVERWWQLVSTRVPPWLLIVALAAVVVAVFLDRQMLSGFGGDRVRMLFRGWDDIDDGASLRRLVLAITGVAAWALSTYARNLYFDHLHVADRLIVIALWAAIAWRPIFVLPFSVVAAAVSGQFFLPLGFISWTEMGVVLRFPALFAAFLLVRAATKQRRTDVFIFAWCCVLAATYWTSGLGKLRINWLSHPHVNLLLLGAYADGWLAFLEPRTVQRAATTIAALAKPFMMFTLLVECGALVMLWRRWSLVAFLLLASTFHLGAFAMTGIFFWKWMLVDACFLIYLLRDHRLVRLELFSPARFALSVGAILTCAFWAPSENLTWFDTPLTYTMKFEGIDARGGVHELPAGFFRPYSDVFALGTIAGAAASAQLTRGMGVTMDRTLAERLEAVRAPNDVFAIEATRPAPARDSTAAATFDDFIRQYAAHATCSAERDPLLIRTLGMPRHLWTFPLDATLPCNVPLVRVRVLENTSFFDGTSLSVIRQRVLRVIDVPTG